MYRNTLKLLAHSTVLLGNWLILLIFHNKVAYAAYDPGGSTGGSATTNILSALINSGAGPNVQLDLGMWVTAIINFAFIIGALGTLLYLIWGALEWITSGGDKAHYEAARGRISNAIVGLAILATSYAIWIIILYFLNIQEVPGFSAQGGSGSRTVCAAQGSVCGGGMPCCEGLCAADPVLSRNICQ